MFSSIQSGEHRRKRAFPWFGSRPTSDNNILDHASTDFSALVRPQFNREKRTLAWRPLVLPSDAEFLDTISDISSSTPVGYNAQKRTLTSRPLARTSDKDLKLLNAASNGELTTVEKLLEGGANPNVIGSKGNTSLHFAAMGGYCLVVERLLQAGADPTSQNTSKWTPKQLATLNKYTAAAKDAEKYVKVIEVFHHPPVVVKGVKQVDTDIQKAPREDDDGRRTICKYFTGHISQWAEGKLQDDEYSVYDIIYSGGLAESVGKLKNVLEDAAKEKVQKEKIARDKKDFLRNRETEDQKKSRDREERRKGKNQNSEQTDQPNREHEEPDIKKNSRRWIHLPANNLYWHLIERLCAEDGMTIGQCKEIEKFITDSFFEHGRRNSGSCFRQPLLYTRRKYPQLMSLVIPFVDADSLPLPDPTAVSTPIQTSESPEEIIQCEKNKELHKRAKFMKSLKDDEAYTGKVHAARTLGQSYYGYTTSSEDVVTRYFQDEAAKGEKEEGEVSELPRLMVKQLWLWTIDKRTIITAAPVRYNKFYPSTLQEYIVRGIDQEPNYTLEAFVKHIVVRTVEFIEDPFKAGLEQQCFDIYSTSIAKVSDDISVRYDMFKTSIEGNSSSRARSDQTKIKIEYDLLRKIRSIIDEINILQPIFDEQHSMTRRLLKWVDVKMEHSKKEWKDNGEDKQNHNSNWIRYLQHFRGDVDTEVDGLQDWEDFEASDQTDIIRQRVQWLDKDAKRVQNYIDTLLNLKQKQASIDSADSAELQGNVVLVFTIATIIFAPLTFVAALLAIPTDNTRINSKGGWSAGYMVAAEFSTWIFLIIVFFIILWRNLIFSKGFWTKERLCRCLRLCSTTKPEVDHTKKPPLVSTPSLIGVRRPRSSDTDLESQSSKNSFDNSIQSKSFLPFTASSRRLRR